MKLTDVILTTPYLDLSTIFYHEVSPTPLKNPLLVSVNPEVAQLLGLNPAHLNDKELENLLNGTLLLEGSRPYAMCYAGHQFGYYVQRLGDGRAINLGALNGWNLQLKGSGVTRYSRQGDGRAVLRSSIREYLISEAMNALGIPTSRALALISSDEKVARERWERGAIVLRLAPSWIRFGSFEYFFHTNKHKELESLADFCLQESFPQFIGSEDAYLKMFAEIVKRTAELIASWQSVGFNHGVMNTDNMSAIGITIDYGPFAFMDTFESGYICNHTDAQGRYSYDNQPRIGYWNLERLAHALSPLVTHEKLQSELEQYGNYFTNQLMQLLRAKLGLDTTQENDSDLLRALFSVMENGRIDMTPFFRTLSRYEGNRDALLALTLAPNQLNEWLERYDVRLTDNSSSVDERHRQMLRTNPKYVLKNYILQEAIDEAEGGNYTRVNDLLRIAQNPYDEHSDFERYAGVTPPQHTNLKLSCSS
ncbi:MAG: YdiU family protein [Sulfuricurvum sp.]|uniref:protein adenylyltransferase SelO n=1 Tax=Sulfuricurvum sp. TaxID=2025608 RepID=UPI00261824D3|nr:YdiU family protein [Sulfuricurvum sp.]MDD2828794.1 YdiU family protein [Sulfuricurvum sp.]MDD4948747.1 YdiU family protein [Sulfuricurvum sp.]